jgi:uroporphyrinogen decarboxylase
MADKMNHIERAMASITNQPADRLSTYPIACGVNRKLLNNGQGISYRDWAHDAKLFADAAIAGYKYFDWDWYFGLMDLSVMAGDLGAHVRMDEQNTPFVDDPLIKDVEGYEKLHVPDVTKGGRCKTIIEGTRLFSEALKNDIITSSFIEGPLLALTQIRGAEYVFKDMYDNESSRKAVHTALATLTEFDKDFANGLMSTPAPGLCWDYLWGSYSCLGDKEYDEFEGQHKYAGCLNEMVAKAGKANCIHNCADLPHLDTQVKAWKPVIYSMAYYPLIPGSMPAKEVIAKGYSDNTLMAGNIDPQGYVRWSPEKMQKVTMNLCNEVVAALKAKGLGARYVIASGCEVPPSVATKVENIKMCVDTVKQYGTFA